jgi:hypothetical protein
MAMSSGNDNERLDAAIDEVARRMTEGAPGADLRARVLERIGEARERRSIWRSPWVLSPIAVAAIVLVAIVVARPFKGGDRGAESPALQPPAVAQVDVPAAAPQPDARPQPPTQTVRLKPDTIRKVRLRPDTTNDKRPSEIDALAPPPLDVESIRLAALPPGDSIQVDPLETITPIDVAPLSPVDSIDSQRREQ